MKKFIVIYHANQAALEKMQQATPEQHKEGMKPWMEWAKKCGNKLVDMGMPLSNGQKVTSHGTTPSNKNVVGYSILQAENMADAVNLLRDHPHLKWTEGCEIEVHETMPMPG